MTRFLWIAVMAVIPINCDPIEMPTEVVDFTRDADSIPCDQWFGHAVAMGWEIEDLPTLGRIMWNESRCQADAHGGSDEWGDHGLTQVYWRVWGPMVMELGYTREDLYHPAVNLLVARLIMEDAEAYGWCKWQPWSSSGTYGCKGAA